MEIDTYPSPNSHPTPFNSSSSNQLPSIQPSILIKLSFNELQTALYPFLQSQIEKALGSEYLDQFLPPSNSSLATFLNMIQKRWISIFCDSPIEPLRNIIESLRANSKQPSLNPTATQADNIARQVEQLLEVVRPSAAAKIAHLRNQLSKSDSNISIPSSDEKRQFQISRRPRAPPQPPSFLSEHRGNQPVVLDGSNIAWRRGSTKFYLPGAIVAYQYFATSGHPTFLFLPEARLERPRKLTADEAIAYDILESMQTSPHLILTPGDDYDDAYICHYARVAAALVVSNDNFKDHVYQANADGNEHANQWKIWFRACRLSYTFQGDVFLPNPAFNYQRAAEIAKRLHIVN